MTVDGTISKLPDGHTEMSASVMFQENSVKLTDIKAYTETLNRTVAFTDKKAGFLNNDIDKAEIHLTACSGLMMLAAAVFPALPADYQDKLNDLLFR